MLINSQPNMVVVGEAANGNEAIALAKAVQPDVVVMDVSMPQMGGIDATRRVRSECPAVRVVGLTIHEERSYVTELLRAGASGCVLKRAAAADLVLALQTVATGALYLDPSIASSVTPAKLAEEEPPLGADDGLSDREREVVMRMARGFSNKEIAAALDISVKTVETYKARMVEKLGLRSRVEIVRYARIRGWLDEPQREEPTGGEGGPL